MAEGAANDEPSLDELPLVARPLHSRPPLEHSVSSATLAFQASQAERRARTERSSQEAEEDQEEKDEEEDEEHDEENEEDNEEEAVEEAVVEVQAATERGAASAQHGDGVAPPSARRRSAFMTNLDVPQPGQILDAMTAQQVLRRSANGGASEPERMIVRI